ncbi:tumor necrosis factor receptor superfamily member 1B-like [Lethenteron reissneri]|nr:tumor necrosis factor receptor superfamily member 1B-like [Lethenteron reissneri]
MTTTMTTVIATMLLVATTGAAAASTVSADDAKKPSPSHPYGLCPPGHRVSLPFSTKAVEGQQKQLEDASHVEARCTRCPPRHYTQFWNSLDRCLYCGPGCKEGQRLAKECSPTHDRVCECEPGTFLLQEFCVPHRSCAAGHGVVTKGTHGGRGADTPRSPHEDTHCAPCPWGFFSPEVSANATCRPHANCLTPGSVQLLPGASTHDALCWSCHERRASVRSREHGDAKPAGEDGAEPPPSNPPPQPEYACVDATLRFVDSVRHLILPCLAHHDTKEAAYIWKLLAGAARRRRRQREGRRQRGGNETKRARRLERQLEMLLGVCAKGASPGGSVRMHAATAAAAD